MGLNYIQPGNMQVDHSGGNISMTKELFYGDDIYALFKEMSSVAVSKGMKINFFADGSIFPGFMHNPSKTFEAVPSVGFLAVEEIVVRFFNMKVFLQSARHVLGKRNDPIL